MLSDIFFVYWNLLEIYSCSVSSAEQSESTLNNSTTHWRDVMTIPNSFAFHTR